HDLFTRDVTARDFQELVGRDPQDTYRFFTREIDFSSLEGKPWYERYPASAWKIFLALAFRLSPARRVLFAASVIVFLVAWVEFRADRVDVSDRALLSAHGSVLSATVFLALLLVELRGQLALKGVLEIARPIQFGLLPFAPFKRDGAAVFAAMRPANTVGGD